jgi:hypothetical protein
VTATPTTLPHAKTVKYGCLLAVIDFSISSSLKGLLRCWRLPQRWDPGAQRVRPVDCVRRRHQLPVHTRVHFGDHRHVDHQPMLPNSMYIEQSLLLLASNYIIPNSNPDSLHLLVATPARRHLQFVRLFPLLLQHRDQGVVSHLSSVSTRIQSQCFSFFPAPNSRTMAAAET